MKRKITVLSDCRDNGNNDANCDQVSPLSYRLNTYRNGTFSKKLNVLTNSSCTTTVDVVVQEL